MAVEAHHHLLHHTGGPPQKLSTTHAAWDGDCSYSGSDVAMVGRQSQLMQQGYQQPSSWPMMTTTGQFGGGLQTDASESGVTFGGGAGDAMMMAAPCRKRKRAAAEQPHQLLGLGVAAHLQQQLVDVDRLVLQHTARMWAELAEQRRRHARQVEAAAAKRLRAKDEEIERMGRLNWALEERVRGLLVEAQVWRDLAQSNEAAAAALRGELQNALDAQQRGGGATQAAAGGAGADDAASCCCGENDVAAAGGEEVEVGSGVVRRCAACGEGAAEVLLLPCRHLCSCAACAAAARACPACGCAKNGTVCVNFS